MTIMIPPSSLFGLVYFREAGPFAHVYALPLLAHKDGLRTPASLDTPWADFEMSAQLDNTVSYPYGFHYGFKNTLVMSLETVERYYRQTAKIHKHLTTFQEKNGRFYSFGSMIAVAFRKMGIPTIIVTTPGDKADSWQLMAANGASCSLSLAATMVDDYIKEKIDHWTEVRWAKETY